MLPHNKLVVLFVIICYYQQTEIEAAPLALASARQFLPPIPGYIPVYIRQGDTPLEDINLDLAEAFRSYAAKQSRLNSINARSQNALTSDEKSEKTINSEDKLQAEPTKLPAANQNVAENTSHHIQKIKPNKAQT